MTGSADLRRSLFALVAGYALVYVCVLGVRPLAEQDEFRYAEVAREMLVSGNWVSPTLDGVRYFEKPVLGYWINAASLAAFGENEFAARLPSAISTGLTALFLGLFVWAATRRFRPAVLSCLVYLTSLGVWGTGTLDILDPLFNLLLTVALGCYFLAWRSGEYPRHRRAWLLAVGIACGLAFMTKGFLALALPMLVVAPFLASQRRWSALITDAWLPIAIAICVALPWSLSIEHREPDFWRYFFWEEHVRRFFGAADAQHARPMWYFLAAFPLMALPWTPLFPAIFAGLRHASVDRLLVRYLLLWFGMPFLFFSISSGKLLSYILPCFPALAILAALGLERCFDGARRRPARAGALALAAVFGVGCLFIAVNRLGGPGHPLFSAAELGRWLLALGTFASGAVMAFLAARSGRDARGPWLLGASMLGILLVAPFALPDTVRLSKMPGEFLAHEASALAPGALIISHGSYVRSVSWTLRRSDVFVFGASELRYGLAYPEAAYRLVDSNAVARMIDENGDRDILIVSAGQMTAAMLPLIPLSAHRAQHGNCVIWLIPGQDAVRTPPAA